MNFKQILTKVLPSYLQNENIAITYQSTVSSLLIPPGDTANITILVTVDPNAAGTKLFFSFQCSPFSA